MKYFLVTYYLKATGKIDEQVGVAKNLKKNDIQTCNIILNFKTRKVEKCVIDAENVVTEWDQIYSYYQQLYPAIFERLEKEAAAS
jgi:hypothetical protein